MVSKPNTVSLESAGQPTTVLSAISSLLCCNCKAPLSRKSSGLCHIRPWYLSLRKNASCHTQDQDPAVLDTVTTKG